MSKGTCHCRRNGVALKCGPPSHSEGPQWTKVRGLWVGRTVFPQQGYQREADGQQRQCTGNISNICYLLSNHYRDLKKQNYL